MTSMTAHNLAAEISRAVIDSPYSLRVQIFLRRVVQLLDSLPAFRIHLPLAGARRRNSSKKFSRKVRCVARLKP
jgi:hypothetical protein